MRWVSEGLGRRGRGRELDGGGRKGERREEVVEVPVLGSRWALLRLWTISVMDLMVPFLSVNVSWVKWKAVWS